MPQEILGLPTNEFDYTYLVGAIKFWLQRDDLEPQIPFLIRIAESQVERRLRVQEMEEEVPLTIFDGRVQLPEDWLETRSVSIAGRYYDLAHIGRDRRSGYWHRDGFLEFAYPPVDETVVDLTYWSKIPRLGGTLATNWLLERAPDIYIYGACLAATPALVEDERMPTWNALYAQAMKDLQASDGTTSGRKLRA